MRKVAFICTVLAFTVPQQAWARDNIVIDPEFEELLSQDIDELTVSTVSKRAQPLSETAAAIYVITQEEMRRAGVYAIPDALRLVPGMHVARVGNDSWAIASRGFNGALSNKLLVLIDGRAIYTPVFSGVYWGDQSTTINDIDRIEVIRGPGGSLYGANAVNGVINIITKSAEETQGNMVSGAASNNHSGIYEARHGGKFGEKDYYRAYGQYVDGNGWSRERAGFRMDGKDNDGGSYTYIGDVYSGKQRFESAQVNLIPPDFLQIVSGESNVYGGNISGKWDQKLSSDSEMSFQAYLDHYTRNELSADQSITTGDVQFQNNIRLNDRNHFVWGAGARIYYQDIAGTFSASVSDPHDLHEVFNAFVQNEYALIPDELYVTGGVKFEYNDFTGFEFQPTARFAWKATDRQTVWGAVSRAVRTPSIIEDSANFIAGVAPGVPLTETRIFGTSSQESEELVAYELGHRFQVNSSLNFDSTAFYNDYDKLLTLGDQGPAFPGPNGNNIAPRLLGNSGSGQVYGFELTSTWQVTPDWQLAGSYSRLHMRLKATDGILTTSENSSPQNQFAIQSYYNITDSVHWDNMLYYVGELSPAVGDYTRFDTRLAWMVEPGLEVSVIGRNLGGSHTEFNGASEIDRSFIAQVLWKF